jgi:tetratricopeptide (TPR) repeat protein
MDRDPDKRQLSAGRLVQELEGGLAPRGEGVAPRQAPAPRTSAQRPRPARRSRVPALAALLAVLLVAGGVVALALSSGSGGGTGHSAQKQSAQKRAPAKKKAPQPQQQQPSAGGAGSSQPQAAGGVEPTGQGGPSGGTRLNDQGYALMRQGRYQDAIPVLERAVRAFPAGSQETPYAYALYNLGASLRRAGRAKEAIPVLERRLRFPNQRDVVQRELDLARRDAGG